ncbi:MAG TPA: CoB--CoM heterodisulfide reductase iron-sulfur subunit A family protein, partial [Anaerolineae bacterium]|nr:CoB--CoM heterodisulfide reductase iron-sulfur subunit A family protein [Anaerolineae bacterium]
MNTGIPATLVIGGGIAGMQAALDIADAGFQVYLVEKEPSIGGRMAQLDKTFPTLDCSSCILTPKMVDVGRHPNIELLTYSEVIGVEGEVGGFKVRVKKKPRYVDVAKCTGCDLCAQACRLSGRLPSEFDAGMGKRAAIYIPFPQAVPLKAVVDPEHCVFLTRGVCGKTFLCKEACPAGAIDFEQQPEFVDLEVGVIIVATGFDPFDPRLKPELGYAIYPNVITTLELERL